MGPTMPQGQPYISCKGRWMIINDDGNRSYIRIKSGDPKSFVSQFRPEAVVRVKEIFGEPLAF